MSSRRRRQCSEGGTRGNPGEALYQIAVIVCVLNFQLLLSSRKLASLFQKYWKYNTIDAYDLAHLSLTFEPRSFIQT